MGELMQEEFNEMVDSGYIQFGDDLPKCCGRTMTEKEYNGIDVKATWKVCSVCGKEQDREVKNKAEHYKEVREELHNGN